MNEFLVNGGRVERAGDLTRLILPAASHMTYADAQLDDYHAGSQRRFVNLPPQQLRLRARFSHPIGVLKGTAGFGFWNHPFTQAGGVVAPPQNAWFFYASPESDMRVVRDVPGHGFKAAVLNTPLPARDAGGVRAAFGRATMAAGTLALKLPVISRLALEAARSIVSAREALLDVDITAWHDYDLDWRPDAAVFTVDGHEVLRAARPPRSALGLVIWIDNYRATASTSGDYAFACVDVPEPQWLEVRGL